MIKTQNFEIVGSYNNQRISSIDAERTVNMFEYNDPLGKKPKSLLWTSGLINAHFTFGPQTEGFRAQYVLLGFMYFVVGSGVFRLDTNEILIQIGTLTTTDVYVGIDANSFQIIFVDGVSGYIWDTTTSLFTQITDPAFPTIPLDVCTLDNFFVVPDGTTNQFQLSSLNQGLIWGADATSIITQTAFTISAASSDLLLTFPTGVSTSNYQVGTPILFSDPGNTDATFTMAAGVADVVLTYGAGVTIADYQVGTPIIFSGGAIPIEFNITDTFYVQSVVNPTTITVSATYGGVAITSVAGGNGSVANKALPVEFNITDTFYIQSIVDLTTITVSATNGGVAITSVLGGTGTFTNNGQLQQGEVISHPGTIVACRTLHRRIFFFSEYFTEIWENAGVGTNLPFRRNNSLLIEYGCAAIGSIAVDFDRLFFLSQDRNGLGSVMMVVGSQAMESSTRALDYTLARFAASTGISDCRSFLIKENGIIFYRMNFTTSDHTFVYNVSHSDPTNDITKYWHEEETLTGNRHPAQTLGYFNGKNFVGSYSASTMYILDVNTYTNDDQRIKRIRITRSFVPPGYQRLRIDRLQLDLLQGHVANLSTQLIDNPIFTENEEEILTESGEELLAETDSLGQNAANLFVFLSISKDGGRSYGYSVKAPMGQTGERKFRTLWRKLGVIPRGQGFVAKFEFYNDYPFVILGASWAVSELPE